MAPGLSCLGELTTASSSSVRFTAGNFLWSDTQAPSNYRYYIHIYRYQALSNHTDTISAYTDIQDPSKLSALTCASD